MGDLSPHFSTFEFQCRDCGECQVSPVLVVALEKLRSLGPEPIRILSGCRCVKHNLEVRGMGKSEHLFLAPGDLVAGKDSEAADFEIEGLTLQQQYDRVEQVAQFLNGGIGVYDGGFIHADVRRSRARWGRVDGKYLGIQESGLLERW